ncbi:hypothetical protein [Streptomyces sp. NPDC054783]
MTGLEAGLWGLFGGFAVEGLDFVDAVHRLRRVPWRASPDDPLPEAGPWAFAVAEIIRLVVGAGLAWAATDTHQVSGPLGALAIGAAAPMVLGQLSRALPLTLPPGYGPPEEAPRSTSGERQAERADGTAAAEATETGRRTE